MLCCGLALVAVCLCVALAVLRLASRDILKRVWRPSSDHLQWRRSLRGYADPLHIGAPLTWAGTVLRVRGNPSSFYPPCVLWQPHSYSLSRIKAPSTLWLSISAMRTNSLCLPRSVPTAQVSTKSRTLKTARNRPPRSPNQVRLPHGYDDQRVQVNHGQNDNVAPL